jgi:hypothetical protein
MDEFGEWPSYYIWPVNHVEGEAYPEDFREKLYNLLRANGYEVERV